MLANCHQGVLCAPTLKIRINDADAEDDDDFADNYHEIFVDRKANLMVCITGVLQNQRKLIMMLRIMMIRLCQCSISHIAMSE